MHNRDAGERELDKIEGLGARIFAGSRRIRKFSGSMGLVLFENL
ncbi:hypothetical protein HMPREF1985_01558 [Mitsuokella sp. oral taxon 131 str. W9106]|nr:hypothetical protein HMPREF1985_01558 [Mitsuokella sp. oral taxon 131 str. W9106]